MILDSISHVLPGCLPASFRGVQFFVPDTSTEAGRRVAESLFPGIDRAAYDDFGLHAGAISVEGLMIGDDYIAQAKALQTAFERPGPGTLIHPWLGPMTALLTEPAEISFSSAELRVVRFSATFKRVQATGGGSLASTVAIVVGAALQLAGTVIALASAPASLTASRAGSLAAARSSRLFSETWSGLDVGRAAVVVMSTLPTSPAASPVMFAASISAMSQALVDVVAFSDSPVAPAAESPAATSITCTEAVNICLNVAARMTALLDNAPSSADRAMLTAAAAEPIATAARLSTFVDFASRNDALALRNRFTGALDDVVEALGALDGSAFAGTASAARLAAEDLRAAIVADIHETIGRLPAIRTLPIERETDAYLIANHLYGDRPERIEAGYRAIVTRNRPRHPAQLPAGNIEAPQ